ncbi:hypothetical protein F4806DRAFT_504823 [Annulohypoxylon nitens]|nr:hypothetical protein F4806DRAFT_504823 [Annulohypoxylon nitens]
MSTQPILRPKDQNQSVSNTAAQTPAQSPSPTVHPPFRHNTNITGRNTPPTSSTPPGGYINPFTSSEQSSMSSSSGPSRTSGASNSTSTGSRGRPPRRHTPFISSPLSSQLGPDAPLPTQKPSTQPPNPNTTNMPTETPPTDIKSPENEFNFNHPLPSTGANTGSVLSFNTPVMPSTGANTTKPIESDITKSESYKKLVDFVKDNPEGNEHVLELLKGFLKPQPSTTPTTTEAPYNPFKFPPELPPPTTSLFPNTGSTSSTTSLFPNTGSTSSTTSPNTGSTSPTTSLFPNTGPTSPSTSLFTTQGTNAPPAQPQNTPATNPPGPHPTPTQVPFIAPIIKVPTPTPTPQAPIVKAPDPTLTPNAPTPEDLIKYPTLKPPSLKAPDPTLTPQAPTLEDPSLKATPQTAQTPATQPDSERHEIIHIYRHAEGLHNIQGGQIPDPYLTTLGLTQCAQIQKNTPSEVPDIIISSPLKRTIQTAIFCFATAIEQKHLRVHLLPELIETGDYPCNLMSDRVLLEEEFGEIIDTTRVPAKGTPPSRSALVATTRALASKQAIIEIIQNYRKKNPEKYHINVMVVTHGAFIPYLVGLSKTEMFGNTEHRSYRLAKNTRTNRLEFTETQTSQDQRKLGKNPKLNPADAELERQLREDYHRRVAAARESGSLLFDV